MKYEFAIATLLEKIEDLETLNSSCGFDSASLMQERIRECYKAIDILKKSETRANKKKTSKEKESDYPWYDPSYKDPSDYGNNGGGF